LTKDIGKDDSAQQTKAVKKINGIWGSEKVANLGAEQKKLEGVFSWPVLWQGS